jgi:hypothetical protein
MNTRTQWVFDKDANGFFCGLPGNERLIFLEGGKWYFNVMKDWHITAFKAGGFVDKEQAEQAAMAV